MIGRGPVTLAVAAGALTAGIAAQAAESPVGSLAWAAAAGIGLSLMLRGVGLRVVGVLVVLIGVGGAVWSAQSAQWVPLAGFVVCAVAAVGMVLWGPGWQARRGDAPERRVDAWAAMDKGDDPTESEPTPGEQDMRRPGENG
ncbi:MAG: hypothetical protein QM713_01825 [Arachnia sp.]